MKNCRQCGNAFQVTDEDRAFYEKVSPVFNGKKYLIPETEMCPTCREQLRLGWKNEIFLYQRTCDSCGKNTMSIYSKEKPFQVYCLECWWGNKWDALSYRGNFDFERSFFERNCEKCKL